MITTPGRQVKTTRETSGANHPPDIPSAKLEPDLSLLPGGQVRTTPGKLHPHRPVNDARAKLRRQGWF